MKRTVLAGVLLALPLAALSVPAQAGTTHDTAYLHAKRLTRTTTAVVVRCQLDGQQEIRVEFPNDDDISSFGSKYFQCTGKRQTVVVPFSTPLPHGGSLYTRTYISNDFSGQYFEETTLRVKVKK